MLHTVETMTGEREEQLIHASIPIAALPEKIRPVSEEEALYIQDALARVYGETGGWKAGATAADATPKCAPMPAAWMGMNGTLLSRKEYRLRGLEAEIAFLLGEDLPQRETSYTREEVIAAIASCHPAIEVLESAFEDPMKADALWRMADLQTHGGFVYGEACADWQRVDFSRESVVLDAEGVVRVEKTGSNPAGDLIRLLLWLANEGAAQTGGLKAGQWVTTGSWTGVSYGISDSAVQVRFSTVGEVHLRFE
jgi:2-keto-4-pentenoate hydratase